MALNWEELAGGQMKLTITDDNGKVPPVIVRGTKDEILTKLATSKINGDRRISELKVNLSPSERLQVVADLNDPGRAAEAITSVVERVVGPLEDFNQDRTEQREERETRRAVEAANTFASNTPEWYPSEHNKKTLVAFMRRMGLSPTDAANYATAFNELKSAELLQPPPAAGENGEGETTTTVPGSEAERTAPAPTTPKTPTRYSTGVRSSDVSGSQPRPTTRLKWTREQIERMSTVTYKQNMRDPEFSKCIDYYAAQDRQRQKRAS
jgi:hypothetical protein